MPELHHGAAAPNVPPCPETAAEQRAALRAKIESETIGREVRAHARAVFEIARAQPPMLAAIFRARQIGELIGEQRERLRLALPGNPAVDIIVELVEEIWAASYDEAARAFDRDPIAIAAAMDANAAAWRTLEGLIAERARDAFDEMRAVERIEKARGVDGPACIAFIRGRALGRMLGTIFASSDPSGPIAFATLEEAVTSSFNEHLAALESLAAAAPAGAA